MKSARQSYLCSPTSAGSFGNATGINNARVSGAWYNLSLARIICRCVSLLLGDSTRTATCRISDCATRSRQLNHKSQNDVVKSTNLVETYCGRSTQLAVVGDCHAQPKLDPARVIAGHRHMLFTQPTWSASIATHQPLNLNLCRHLQAFPVLLPSLSILVSASVSMPSSRCFLFRFFFLPLFIH